MAISVMFCIMMALSIIFASVNGTTAQAGNGLMEGAQDAVTLVIGMMGTLCLWCGVTEVMRQSGLSDKLTRLLRHPIRILFPEAREDMSLHGDLAGAISANILGLGNAATPLSIRACSSLHRISGNTGAASDSACMLVILGATSIQIFPSTIAAVRAGAGAQSSFDILPAVWLTTLVSCTVSVGFGLIMRHRG
ncbi:MAG: spore maturation protein A [Oscillospiraceae bacterium]|nr:spore maturation protein A [Oscillospiraceae bacterium]